MDIPKSDISIIIPALNEAKTLPTICESLIDMGHEGQIIIVDGGSTDRTPQLAASYGQLLYANANRALQMNAGAKNAQGKILWFLHADCIPHPNSVNAIQKVMANRNIVGGAFSYRMDAKGIIYRLSEFLSNEKNRLFRWFYGENGIFVRKTVFEALGGYREIPIMEDIDFCLQLKKMGKVVILPQPILSSARRWKSDGPIKNIIRNWLLQIGWRLGISPQLLVKFYPLNQNQ